MDAGLWLGDVQLGWSWGREVAESEKVRTLRGEILLTEEEKRYIKALAAIRGLDGDVEVCSG